MATRKKKKKKGSGKLVKVVLAAVAAVLLIGAYLLFAPNTGALSQGEYLYIHTGSNYNQVRDALKEGGFVRDMTSFELLAKEAGYPDHVHPGRYEIHRGMSNFSIVRLLRSGKQKPLRLVIGKLRGRDEFIHLIGTKLEADSMVLRRMMSDRVYLAQFGLDSANVLCAVMPDTYEFYWTTNADKAFRRIEKNFAEFWTEDRKEAAKKRNMSPQQAMVLASIVEEESNKHDEQPNIASVYLNRIKKGMKLQADPTARFAAGDFTLRRITSAQTSIASPYNTYYVYGLPPGPICTPSPKTINAVLQSPSTDFLYFCAKEDFSGYHRFASSYADHMKNAALYQRALNAQGIR
jgi:UPF0755 protein